MQMKHTQAYRNQHDEIRSATRALAAVVSGGDMPAIRKALTHLSALIDVHVYLEDSAFYPALYKHADPELGRIAKAYQESMGKLASVYTAFCSRWMRPGAIEEDASGFAKELGDVCTTLERRMDLENNTLYMMVDGLTNIAV
ncbi:MAG: hemerythrin domain-containing protein [Candidatus Aquilonibacter sp.]